jgi:ankyrin repeat protein
MQAASTGNMGLVEFTLMAGANVSMVADDGSTALHCATKTGQIEMMRYLLRIGAKVDTRNSKGRTPLLEAVQNRDHPAFTLLLQSKASVSQRVLNDIIRDGQVGLLQTAFDYSSDLFQQHNVDPLDQYIFRTVAMFDQTPTMELLLSLPHFDRTWLEQYGNPTISSIVAQGRTGVLRCLLASSSISPNMHVGVNTLSPLLHLAAARGQTGIVDVLLACKTLDVNDIGGHGYTALQRAAISGSAAVVERLLCHPAIEVNKYSAHRPKALYLAARYDQVTVLELLLRHKSITLNSEDFDDRSALRAAVSYGATRAVQLLLAQPNNDDENTYRTTLLQLASQRGQLSMIKLLLKHEHVSLEDPRDSKQLLLREALWNLQWHVVEFLLLYVGELSRSDSKVASTPRYNSSLEILELLLQHGSFSITETDRTGQSLLHKAAKQGELSILTRLVALQTVDINLLDNKGWSALHCAAFTGQLGTVEFLMMCESIDVNVSTRRYGQEGVTALALAKRKGFTDMIDLLESHGAKDTEKRTPVPDDITASETNEAGEGSEPRSESESERPEDLEFEGRTDATAIVIQDSADEMEDATHDMYNSATDDPVKGSVTTGRATRNLNRWKADIEGLYPADGLYAIRRPDPARGINKFGKPMMY